MNNYNDTCAWCDTETTAPGLCNDCEQIDKRAAAEDLAHDRMEAACDAYNAARRDGTDAATLNALRAAHADARDEWRRACEREFACRSN